MGPWTEPDVFWPLLRLLEIIDLLTRRRVRPDRRQTLEASRVAQDVRIMRAVETRSTVLRKPRFSERHGFDALPEIAYRDELPPHLKGALIDLLKKYVGAKVMMDAAHRIFDPFGISPFPKKVRKGKGMSDRDVADKELEAFTSDAAWYQVYDLAEQIYSELVFYEDELGPHPDEEPRAYPMQLDITKFFELAGIGWKMDGGRIVSRFDPVFEASVRDAGEALRTAGRTTAATQLREAMAALSRRPEPNLSGAVFHAMAAFEALARDVARLPKATVGEIVKKRRDLFPKPLDKSLEMLWGYASNEARHASETRAVALKEATLLVRLAAALIVYVSE